MNLNEPILLAEDKQSDAEMTIRAIRKSRIENTIIHVKDGAEALDFLFATGKYADRDLRNKPKFIILDLKMPKLDGIEVIKQLRENDLTKKIPVVVFTSSKENADVEQCYALGVNSYIVKPMLYEDFMKVVEHLGLYWMKYNQPPL